eukprot:14608237-Alexandrium_andersonii.AAC.1
MAKSKPYPARRPVVLQQGPPEAWGLAARRSDHVPPQMNPAAQLKSQAPMSVGLAHSGGEEERACAGRCSVRSV